ncbi:MAG: zinc ribbon domain-containing protein [Burkholderiaceae bacterium]|jgi:putative FmdB family regulatory protein|nr:zinc ribbon domain-containing protein [Burkholderiaceae bacterium]
MPIYAYKCASCGFAKDVLQKMSDPPLTVCPRCAQATMQKQVTAAGFQLKGSGWYVTDFRGGGNGALTDKEDKKGEAGSETSAAKNDAKPASAGESKDGGGATPAASTPASSGDGAD